MREVCEQSEDYAAIGADLINTEPSLQWINDSEISIGYLTSNKAKVSKGQVTFGECRKVPPWAAPFVPYDFLIIIYEQNCFLFDAEQMRILIHHELLHVGLSEKGDGPVYQINPHDVEDFREIIDRYGLDWAK